MKGFLTFYLGKIAAVVILCMIASGLGSTLMDANGYIGPIAVKHVVDVLMILTGIVLSVKWAREHVSGKKNCDSCHSHHGHEDEKETIRKLSQEKPQYLLLFGLGGGYGITPCAPLILILSYCIALPMWGAVLSGMIFTLASSLSPMLLVFLISGGLSGKLRQETPQFLEYFQLLFYVLLIGFSVYSLLSGATLAL